jgi:hypothetical protein
MDKHIFLEELIQQKNISSMINEESITVPIPKAIEPVVIEIKVAATLEVVDPVLEVAVQTPEPTLIYNIFVYCGGKCGSTTLNETFKKNNYSSLHVHSNEEYHRTYKTKNTIFNVIDLSCKNFENVYIIDSYRTPIERKISSFFENAWYYLPNYNDLTINQMIDFFNVNLIDTIEEYHSIDEVLKHYNFPLFTEFNFEKKYNITKKDNKIFIKLLFKDIHNWDIILSGIFQKDIIMHNENLTKDKPINDLYEEFKKNYKVPKTYIENILKNDIDFKIYNTEKEQEEYIAKWLELSY